MTDKERKLALYCLKASSDYHSEVCEECIKYPNCDHTGQDDVTETIIKALEQEPKTGHWIKGNIHEGIYCSECETNAPTDYDFHYMRSNYCPNCGARMVEPQEG